MYHARFNGHIMQLEKNGRSLLSKNGKQLLDNIPFNIKK